MFEVYDVDGGRSKRLEWKGAINPAVAQLAGYEIVEKAQSFLCLTYFVKRRTCNRL